MGEIMQKAKNDKVYAKTIAFALSIEASKQSKLDETTFLNSVNSTINIFNVFMRKPKPKVFPVGKELIKTNNKPKNNQYEDFDFELVRRDSSLIGCFS